MPGQPRLRLTPMQREVLWLCEEAGAETLAMVANQTHHLVTWSCGPDERYEIAEAIEGLRRLGFVELCYFDPPPDPTWVRETKCASLRRLSVLDLLTFTDDGQWTTRRPEGLTADCWIEVCMTDEGHETLAS